LENLYALFPRFGKTNRCFSKHWKNFSVTPRFRGATCNSSVENPDGVCKGVTVNGEAINGNLRPKEKSLDFSAS